MIDGQVTSVEVRLAGTQLVGSHPSGSTILSVADVSMLPEQGNVLVGSDTLPYTAIDALEDADTLATTDTIFLGAPTTATYPTDTPVLLTPTREYKVALVSVDSDPSVSIETVVKHSLYDRLAEGPRQPGAGELVKVVAVPGEPTLLLEDVFGRKPKVDGGYITPGTAPGPTTAYVDAGDASTQASAAADATSKANAALASANTYTDGKLAPGAWQTATLAGAWAVQSEAVRYRLEGSGIVRLQGRVKSGVSGTTVLTLPTGFKPAVRADLPCATDTNVAAWAQCLPAGGITLTVAGAFGWVSLSSIILTTT